MTNNTWIIGDYPLLDSIIIQYILDYYNILPMQKAGRQVPAFYIGLLFNAALWIALIPVNSTISSLSQRPGNGQYQHCSLRFLKIR